MSNEKMSAVEETTLRQMELTDEDRGRRMLARVQGIIVACRNSYGVLECGQDEFKELLAFLSVKSPEELEKLYPDEQVFGFRDVNGRPMKGLIIKDESEMAVCFDYPSDAPFNQLVADQQKLFVVKKMIPKCHKAILRMANRELTRKELEEIPPDRLNRMETLVDKTLDCLSPKELAECGAYALREKIATADAIAAVDANE